MAEDKTYRIVLIGPQGSGKGTQAELLKEKLGVPHISTGDMFRENIKEQTELGKKAKEIIDAGRLVPDELTTEMVRERLSRDDCGDGFILDGYPRNLSQAEALDGFAGISHAIEIHVPDEVSVKRLSSRRQCRNCGAIYGLNRQPEKEGVCDKCGGELYQRDDDKPEAIEERLAVYHRDTEPVIDLYMKKGILLRIDGDQTVDRIFNDILAGIGRG
ncbi:MAG: adenylate kinase [Candidatus Woesearchaeota archaeon]